MELAVSIAILTVAAGGVLVLIGYLGWPRQARPAIREQVVQARPTPAKPAEARTA